MLPRRKPLKRGSPPERRTRLARGSVEVKRTRMPARTVPLRAKPDSGRTPAETVIWVGVKLLVGQRADGHCEAHRSPWCNDRYEHPHHRWRRGQGGPDSVANVLASCWACHRHIHDHPTESYRLGHLIRTGT